jgi:hypothetical protein
LVIVRLCVEVWAHKNVVLRKMMVILLQVLIFRNKDFFEAILGDHALLNIFHDQISDFVVVLLTPPLKTLLPVISLSKVPVIIWLLVMNDIPQFFELLGSCLSFKGTSSRRSWLFLNFVRLLYLVWRCYLGNMRVITIPMLAFLLLFCFGLFNSMPFFRQLKFSPTLFILVLSPKHVLLPWNRRSNG